MAPKNKFRITNYDGGIQNKLGMGAEKHGEVVLSRERWDLHFGFQGRKRIGALHSNLSLDVTEEDKGCHVAILRPTTGEQVASFDVPKTSMTELYAAMNTSAAQYNPPSADSRLKCPHCEAVGTVTSKKVNVKAGVSGGKAAAAVLTAGVSVIASGLSRKEARTQMTCSNCKTSWLV